MISRAAGLNILIRRNRNPQMPSIVDANHDVREDDGALLKENP
jgi:hypothetical protein